MRQGGCQGCAALSGARPGLDAGAPSITLRAFEGGSSNRRGTGAGRALSCIDTGASPALGGSPGRRGSAATDHRQGRHNRLHPGAQRYAEPPGGRKGGKEAVARAERSGAGAFRCAPAGGGSGKQGAASVRAPCCADGGQEHGLAAHA